MSYCDRQECREDRRRKAELGFGVLPIPTPKFDARYVLGRTDDGHWKCVDGDGAFCLMDESGERVQELECVDTSSSAGYGAAMNEDAVNHPSHYTYGPMEVIDVIEEVHGIHDSFHLANAVKYLFRAGRKDDAVQDMKKAVWYLDRFYQFHQFHPHAVRSSNRVMELLPQFNLRQPIEIALRNLLSSTHNVVLVAKQVSDLLKAEISLAAP